MQVLLQTSVAIFPEGTSSHGEAVAAFKPAAFAAALQAKVPVVGWSLAYPLLGGKAFSRRNHHYVCWYGDMSFGPSFARLAKLGSIHVAIEPVEVPYSAVADRKILAQHGNQK